MRDVLLTVRVNGDEVAAIGAGDVPCEITPTVPLSGATTVEFEDAAGMLHRHSIPARTGWLHLSVRVHAGLGCQADAVVTPQPEHRSGAPLGQGDVGVRFQPFFLAGAPQRPDLSGRGLFARGLHYRGLVTPANILLSCECDACSHSFLVRSFHAGTGQHAYFYAGSGRYTLIVDGHRDGAPVPLAPPDPDALHALEATLPPAPDGTRFAYHNPFRCPHCGAAYIDFDSHPGQWEGEYYGLYLADMTPLHATAEDRPTSTPASAR